MVWCLLCWGAAVKGESAIGAWWTSSRRPPPPQIGGVNLRGEVRCDENSRRSSFPPALVVTRWSANVMNHALVLKVVADVYWVFPAVFVCCWVVCVSLGSLSLRGMGTLPSDVCWIVLLSCLSTRWKPNNKGCCQFITQSFQSSSMPMLR